MMDRPTDSDLLTGREQDILRLIALGLSNRDIAEELVIAQETVRWYSKQIYSKLGVSGRVQALNRARELGLLDHDHRPAASDHDLSQGNLPVSITAFIGRSHEVADVKRLLAASRLLTLTGVGGTGKTRLALHAVAQMAEHFVHGAYFVDLAPVSDHRLVTNAIATALGVIENPAEVILDSLKRAIAGREILLVIDNFEHVIVAAPVLADLLATAPRLKILVTSREALRLSGEQEYIVPPLSLSPSDAVGVQPVMESEAGALFVKRVQMVQLGFEVTADNAMAITQICARLDGLPLAIELAAARCKLLTPQALLERLDKRLDALAIGKRDAPARQQTLRRTLDWSYKLLDGGEKTLFARLAVFHGGRSLEAVEAVCGPALPIDVLDGLASLVDKSLLQLQETASGEPRFVLLETIHEYARERLAESGDADVIRRRYAEYFVNLAERAEPELRQAEHARWSQLLEMELVNLRAVLAWSLDGGDPGLGLRLASALYLFWWAYGYHVEGRYWTQQLRARMDEVSPALHPRFLFSAGHLAFMYDSDEANHLFKRVLELSQKAGDTALAAWALIFLGYTMLSDPAEALALAEEGLAILRDLELDAGIAQALNIIGEIARFNGDDDRAKAAYEECLMVAQKTGETRRIQLTLGNLAFIAQHEGDHNAALKLARQALRLAQEMDNRLEMACSLVLVAGAMDLQGQANCAARVLGASEAAFGIIGAFHVPSDDLEIERIITEVRVQLDEASFEAAWAEGRAMTLEQAVELALADSR